VYYSTGKLKQERTYKNHKVNGALNKYYSNGKLERSSNYINGLEDGVSKSYLEDGTLNNELSYKNGLLNGVSKEKIEVDYTTGKIAEDIAWAKKLVESGAFKRLDEFIEQQRRDKKSDE